MGGERPRSPPYQDGTNGTGGAVYQPLSGNPLYVRALDYLAYGNSNSAWYTPLRTVTQQWTNSTGPQNFKYFNRNPDTHVQYYGATQAEIDVFNDGAWGVTRNCPNGQSTNCPDWPGSATELSIVYILQSLGTNPQWTAGERRWLISHETGHTLGLGHHSPASEQAVMRMPTSGPYASSLPTSYEIGSYPCPASQDDWGIKCIYGWNSSAAGGGEP